MKSIRHSVSLLAACALTLVVAGGCKKSDSVESLKVGPVASAEKTSFKEVTSQLDPGGTLYLYLSTEQWLDGLSGKISGWRQFLAGIPDVDAEKRGAINNGFDIVTRLIKESGIEDVSGFGMSSVARGEGIYHSKAFVHHYKGHGDGFAWKLFGEKTHALDGLELLPDNTALAVFSDLDIALMWSVVEKESARSGFPQAAQAVKALPEQFEKATGVKWAKLLGSLGGEYGIVLTLDPSHMIPVPIPGSEGIQVPEPALMIVARVNDDTVFNRLDQALKDTRQQVMAVDEGGVKMRTVAVPLPLPISLRPTVATSDGFLFIASSDALIREALAVKGGKKPGLKATDEFKQLSKDTPQNGNQFSFVSRRLGQTIVDIQQRAIAAQGKMQPAQTKWLQSMLDPNKAAVTYVVGANTDEGWLTVGNGNQNPAQMLAISTLVVPVGLLSAIAIPNFVKARQTSQGNACINNLRQIDAAKNQWALEERKTATAVPVRSDIELYLKQYPVCPQGGTYTIGSVADQPRCSTPGHEIKQR